MIKAEIRDDYPDKIALFGVSPSYKEICSSMPGCLFNKKENQWMIPLGWANCLALRSTFKDNLEIGENLNEWALREIDTRIKPALELREAMDAPGLESLYPFQRAGVQFLKTAKCALLADAMGTGKTRQTIVALMEHYKDGTDPFPALVVCPNSTKRGWKREFDEVWPGLTVTVVDGTSTQRRKQLATPSHVYIMNWESVRSHSKLAPFGSTAFKKCVECGGTDPKLKPASCHKHIKELNEMEFKAVVGDEIHRIKDPSSQTARAFKAATGDAGIRIALSGTPFSNTPDELWSALNWLSPAEWPSKTKFVDRMLDVQFDMWGAKKVAGIRWNMKDEFFAALDPRMRRTPKEVALPFLPEVVYIKKQVEMSAKQKKAYAQMRDHMIAEMEGSDPAVVVSSAMQKTLRLMQFSSSFAETESYEEIDKVTGELKTKIKVTLTAPSNKIDAFMSDLEDYGSSQIVVFANSRQLINLLSDRMTKAGLEHGLITGDIGGDERQEYMDEFQAGRLKYILCTTQAGGTGITLTAADTVVFLQRPWSLIDSLQAQDRVRRIGSEIHESIKVVDYVSTDTVDEKVIDTLVDKGDRLEEVLRDKELIINMLKGI